MSRGKHRAVEARADQGEARLVKQGGRTRRTRWSEDQSTDGRVEKTKNVHEASAATSDRKTYLVAKRRDGNPLERDEYLSAITKEVKHKMKAEKAVTVDFADSLREWRRRTEIIQEEQESLWRHFQTHLAVWEPSKRRSGSWRERCGSDTKADIQEVSKGINMVKDRRHLWCLTKGHGWDRNSAEEG